MTNTKLFEKLQQYTSVECLKRELNKGNESREKTDNKQFINNYDDRFIGKSRNKTAHRAKSSLGLRYLDQKENCIFKTEAKTNLIDEENRSRTFGKYLTNNI